MRLKKAAFVNFSFLLLSILMASGCQPSYPKDRVESDIQRICQEEYGIDDVKVKILGKTLGVYLPLKQLFSVDYEKILSGESASDLENLVRFHPEALDKVEDVLFSTSRVILSTNREIDFYLLNATDTLITGLQFSIIGYVLDMKRVRFWDISRDEYRKRLIHDISINKSVVWKKNIVRFFQEFPQKRLPTILQEYAKDPEGFPSGSAYFYEQLQEAAQKPGLAYELMDVRVKPLSRSEVLAYAKVRETFDPMSASQETFRFKNGFVGEYLFILSLVGLEYKISQVIPFFFLNQEGNVEALQFPDNLRIYQSMDEWPDDFELDEVSLEDFIALQLTKRVQALLIEDPKIRTDFVGLKQEKRFSFIYEHNLGRGEGTEEGYFILNFFIRLKEKLMLTMEDLTGDERVLYLMEKVLQEFMRVVRAYDFKGYSHLDVQLPVSDSVLMITKENLEKYRKKKWTIQELVGQSPRFD